MSRLLYIYSYWDSSFDDELLENKVAMNLLYVQVGIVSLYCSHNSELYIWASAGQSQQNDLCT